MSILSKLLRPFAPAATLRSALNAASSAEAAPTQGLIQVDWEVIPSAREGAAELQVLVEGRKALAKPLVIEAGARLEGWFALHGHLLPNGPVQVRLQLVADGVTVAERDLTVHVRNTGEVASWVRSRLEGRGTPLVLDGDCDSRLYDYGDASLTAWFDRSPSEVEAHLQGLEAAGEADATELAALRHFAENGYLTLHQAIGPELLGRLNAALDDVVANKVKGYEWGSSERLENLHDNYPAIRELWTHPKVMRMLKLIFGVPAKPCQTLSYVFGSQQQHHQDTIHLTPFPAGRMCGVWTALEDVREGSGELVVFPRSHRLPRVYMADCGVAKVTDGDWTEFGEVVVPEWTRMINEAGFAPQPYRAKAGDVLIWHENLMHAGMPRADMALSRRSIVGHYFADGAIAYYDSSGRPGRTHDVEAA